MILPFLFFCNPSGHDFEFHMNSWMEVLRQWQHGIVYPRWAELAHFGFGEPRFIFYPPSSWILGAALGRFLPWKAVPGAYVWLTLTLSGCSMFLLARSWLSKGDAMFAAVLYVANPYYIVLVYWRSALAELLAGALLPLLLLYVLRIEENDGEVVVPLSLILAAGWLTNLPAAVMLNYSLMLLAVVVAFVCRSPGVLLRGAQAATIGAALAAFFLLPAAYESQWVNIDQVLSPGVRPQDNFLFTYTYDPDHNRFNLLVSLITSIEITVIAAAFWSARRRWRGLALLRLLLSSWTVAGVLLLTPLSMVLWRHLPLLQFVQIPWRWLICLGVIFSLLLVIGWQRQRGRIAAYAVMLLVIVFAGLKVQPAWWDDADYIAGLVQSQKTGAGYEGTDEYTPKGADGYNISQSAPLVAFKGNGTVRVQMQQWETESKRFTAEASEPGQLALRLFNYPAWQVEVNGAPAVTSRMEDTGQTIIPVQAGENHVRIRFKRTWDRTAGAVISLVSCGFLLLIGCTQRRKASSVSS